MPEGRGLMERPETSGGRRSEKYADGSEPMSGLVLRDRACEPGLQQLHQQVLLGDHPRDAAIERDGGLRRPNEYGAARTERAQFGSEIVRLITTAVQPAALLHEKLAHR